MHQGLPWQARCQLIQSSVASGPPPTRESPPRTTQRSPRTHDRWWSRSPPTRSLHACDDDATVSISAKAIFLK